MSNNLSVTEVLTKLERRMAFHQEKEAHHAGRGAFHREQRSSHAAELEAISRNLRGVQGGGRSRLADSGAAGTI